MCLYKSVGTRIGGQLVTNASFGCLVTLLSQFLTSLLGYIQRYISDDLFTFFILIRIHIIFIIYLLISRSYSLFFFYITFTAFDHPTIGVAVMAIKCRTHERQFWPTQPDFIEPSCCWLTLTINLITISLSFMLIAYRDTYMQPLLLIRWIQ